MVAKTQNGFTLIELMVVVAIIGLLVTVVIPAGSHYTNMSRFSEVVLAVSNPKTAVDVCVEDKACVVDGRIRLDDARMAVRPPIPCVGEKGGLDGSGKDNLGNQCREPRHEENILSLAYTKDGTVTVTANAGRFGGVEGTPDATYIITPNVEKNGSVYWAAGGSCKSRAGGAIC